MILNLGSLKLTFLIAKLWEVKLPADLSQEFKMPIEDMKQLRLPGHGNIREQAINVREHRVVISCLQALMSTTLCVNTSVLMRLEVQ